MKYLLYFRPGEELSDLILRQNHLVLPGSGLHSTLCSFPMGEDREGDLVARLRRISFDSFEIETLGYDDFDKDSLVLKLSRSPELLRLHNRIILAVGNYADSGFEGIVENYFGYENYNPHITVSRSSSDFDRSSRELLGHRDVILEYHLAKKIDGEWKDVETFG